MSESAREAMDRAVAPLLDEIREDCRRVIERIVSRDEDGRPRLTLVEPQIEDADEREAKGIF